MRSGLHGADDFCRVHLAERAGGHGEILAECGNRPARDVAGADHNAVGRKFLLLRDTGLSGAADVHADFLEGAFLEQCGKALAGGHPALVVTGVRLVFAAARKSSVLSIPEVLENLGVQRHGGVILCRRCARDRVRSAAAPPGSQTCPSGGETAPACCAHRFGARHFRVREVRSPSVRRARR
jgi:hypothetical protein